MKRTHLLKNCFNEKGQGLVEYALILVLVAIVVIGILLLLGPTVSQVYCRIANALQPGSCGAITSYEIKATGSLQVKNIVVSKPATIEVSIEDSTLGEQTQSQSCTPSSCPNITFGGIGSGTGTITTEHGDYIAFSY
jgi:pilus assembly protein Flp/PilA